MTTVRALVGNTWWYACLDQGRWFMYPELALAYEWDDIADAREDLPGLQVKFQPVFILQLHSLAPEKIS